jgi:LysR family glycine cleavage system transcriptional activator
VKRARSEKPARPPGVDEASPSSSATFRAIADLRIHDLVTFLVVRRTASISGAARELKVTPSQVSKAITRLEAQLGSALFVRQPRGLALTTEGLECAPTIEGAVEHLRRLGRPDGTHGHTVTIAGPAYLLACLVPHLAAVGRGRRVRMLELPPAQIRAYAAQNVFDVAVLPSPAERITPPWIGTHVGEMTSVLLATPEAAKRLGPSPVSEARVRAAPMVTPVSDTHGVIAPVDDDCPLNIASRTIGFEVQTVATALRVAAATGQLAFGPRLAARDYLRRGELVEVEVAGWDVREALFVACNHDRVLAPMRAQLVRAAIAAFRE